MAPRIADDPAILECSGDDRPPPPQRVRITENANVNNPPKDQFYANRRRSNMRKCQSAGPNTMPSYDPNARHGNSNGNGRGGKNNANNRGCLRGGARFTKRNRANDNHEQPQRNVEVVPAHKAAQRPNHRSRSRHAPRRRSASGERMAHSDGTSSTGSSVEGAEPTKTVGVSKFAATYSGTASDWWSRKEMVDWKQREDDVPSVDYGTWKDDKDIESLASRARANVVRWKQRDAQDDAASLEYGAWNDESIESSDRDVQELDRNAALSTIVEHRPSTVSFSVSFADAKAAPIEAVTAAFDDGLAECQERRRQRAAGLRRPKFYRTHTFDTATSEIPALVDETPDHVAEGVRTALPHNAVAAGILTPLAVVLDDTAPVFNSRKTVIPPQYYSVDRANELFTYRRADANSRFVTTKMSVDAAGRRDTCNLDAESLLRMFEADDFADGWHPTDGEYRLHRTRVDLPLSAQMPISAESENAPMSRTGSQATMASAVTSTTSVSLFAQTLCFPSNGRASSGRASPAHADVDPGVTYAETANDPFDFGTVLDRPGYMPSFTDETNEALLVCHGYRSFTLLSAMYARSLPTRHLWRLWSLSQMGMNTATFTPDRHMCAFRVLAVHGGGQLLVLGMRDDATYDGDAIDATVVPNNASLDDDMGERGGNGCQRCDKGARNVAHYTKVVNASVADAKAEAYGARPVGIAAEWASLRVGDVFVYVTCAFDATDGTATRQRHRCVVLRKYVECADPTAEVELAACQRLAIENPAFADGDDRRRVTVLLVDTGRVCTLTGAMAEACLRPLSVDALKLPPFALPVVLSNASNPDVLAFLGKCAPGGGAIGTIDDHVGAVRDLELGNTLRFPVFQLEDVHIQD